MMTGKLVRWNDEKGYGFIHTDSEKRDVFIHISVLAHMSRRPAVGDTIFFDMETDADGKSKAVRAKIEGVPRLESPPESWTLAPKAKDPGAKPAPQSTPPRIAQPARRDGRPGRKNSRFPQKLAVLLFAMAAGFAYRGFISYPPEYASDNTPIPQAPAQPQVQFHCQGKKRCPEMTSCAEATFYLRNCPGTEMDGDHDGIPCEDQWCR